MRKYWSALIIILILPLVLAQDDVSQDPGVTPDNFLWGVDRALEQISLLLAANPESKAAKGLEIAQERLFEVKAMAEAKNLPALEKAQKAHGEVLLKVKENIRWLDDEDSEVLLEKELELDKKLLEHQENLAEITAKLKVKIKIEGVLTSEQQARLDEFLVSLGESAEDVKVEIKSKKDLTKIRIKEQTGKSKEEIEEDVEKLERGKGLLGEKIKVRAETDGGKSLVKVELSFDTSAADKEALLAEIVERFSLDADTAASLLKVEDKDEKNAENGDGEETETKEAAEEAETVEEEERLQVKVKTEDGSSEVTIKLRFSLNSTDTAEIANAIAEKTQLTAEQVESVWKVKEKKPGEKKELEIEVEIEDGEAKVKVETGGSKAKFMLEETDREKIVQEIAAKLGISVDEVLKFVTFEEETEEPETEEDEDGEDDSEDETKEADGVKKEKGNGDEDEDDEDSEEGNGSNVSDNE